jgi:CRISPR-associated protein Cas2
MADKKFYVISYDIVDDRKRFKASEALKDYGCRVQKSVFEAKLDLKTFSKLIDRLRNIIDKDTDNVLVYMQCEACLKQKLLIGLKVIGAGEKEGFRVL